ncbi:hypothetical protein [Sulfuracidifex tepidarius]|nr:hypothetical protein [Sulfuracidifex tepidarius]
MTIRFPTIDKLYNYIDRVIIGILTGFISFNLLKGISLPYGVNYFVTALIVVASVLLAGLMPALLMIGAVTLEFLKTYSILGTDLFGKPDIEFLALSSVSLILLIIIPIISYAKYLDLSSYVISLAIISSLIGPTVNYLLLDIPLLIIAGFFAITQKKTDIGASILSPLPFFSVFLLNFTSADKALLLIAAILIEISSILSFYLKNGIAIVAGVPPIISSIILSVSLPSVNKEIILLSSIMSLAGISTYVGYSYLVSVSVYKNEITLKKKSLTEDLQEAIKGLKDLDAMKSENFPVTNSVQLALMKMDEINKKIGECNSPKCLDQLREEMEAALSSVSRYVNDIIFEKIITFNNVIDELKNKGLVIDKIEIPKDELKIDSNTSYTIARILSKIESEYTLATQTVLKIADKLNETTGIELTHDVRVIPDIEKLPSFYDKLVDPVIMEKINNCLDNLLLLLQNINEMKEEKDRNVEIFKSIIDAKQLKGINKIDYSYDTIKRGLNYVYNFVNGLIDESSAIISVYPFLTNITKLDVLQRIKQTLTSEGVPMCRKINVLSSSVKMLEDTSSVLKYKDYLKDIDSIVLGIKGELQSDGKQCISLEELGIKKDLVPFIDAKIKDEKDGILIIDGNLCRSN